jgi:hypothetical protein
MMIHRATDPSRPSDDEAHARMADWARETGCRLAILFGSAARGDARDARDVDVALEFDALPDASRRLSLIQEAQALTHPSSVDLVFLHRDTSPVLRFEVFRGGRCLFESESGLFVERAVRALALYEDARPFRDALRRHVVREGGR